VLGLLAQVLLQEEGRGCDQGLAGAAMARRAAGTGELLARRPQCRIAHHCMRQQKLTPDARTGAARKVLLRLGMADTACAGRTARMVKEI
jgi:hypothetical protein